MRRFRPSSQRGFTLLEVLLAIGVSLSIGALALTELRRDSEAAQAKAVGEQARIVGNAMDSYLALQYTHIVQMEDVLGVGDAADPGVRDCTPNASPNTGGMCTITLGALVNSGLLPESFSGRNAYGADYQFFIRVEGSPSLWRVEGLVVTDRPYTTGGGNRYDLLGIAMQAAGADSGMTRTDADRIEGLNGTWASEGDYPAVNQLGLLAVRAGYGTNGYSAFLRIDGSNAMTGALDMGANNILDAGIIVSNDEVRAQGFRAVDGIELGDPDALTATGAVGASANRVTMRPTSGGQLQIRGNDGVIIQDIAGTGLETLAAGNTTISQLSVASGTSGNGTITTNGNITSNASIISANDLTAGGNLLVNGNARVVGNLTGDGNATFSSGTVTGQYLTANQELRANGYRLGAEVSPGTNQGFYHQTRGGGWYIPDTVYVRTPKSIYVDGGARVIGDVVADGDLSVGTSGAGGQVQLNSAVTQGGACTGNGLLARASTGVIVQCVSSVWRKAGLDSSATANSTTVAGPGTNCASFPAATATCPAGTVMTGGGYILVAHNPSGPGYDGNAPSQSYPSGNAWRITVDCRVGTSTFQAYAVCAR